MKFRRQPNREMLHRRAMAGVAARQAKRDALAAESGGWTQYSYVLQFAVDPSGRFVALTTDNGPMICGSLRTIRSKVAQAIFRKAEQTRLPMIGKTA